VRVKKKTSVGLLVFNPVRATVAYKIFDWVIDTIRDPGWKKSDLYLLFCMSIESSV
jgi:hypothetical protein